jgi:hypothetical protein
MTGGMPSHLARDLGSFESRPDVDAKEEKDQYGSFPLRAGLAKIQSLSIG